MKRNELISYTSDFLSLLYLKKDFLDNINSIVLFGSVARGDFVKDSDIDLFIDTKNEKDTNKLQEIVNDTLSEFEIKAKETWHLRNIKNPIKCIVASLHDERWSLLKKEMQSYGIIFYGSFKSEISGLSSYSLFEYSLKKFNQKNRVAFQRELIGYKSEKNNKTYLHRGIVEKMNGINLENNNVLIPSNEALDLQKFFTKRKVTPKIKEIWMKNK